MCDPGDDDVLLGRVRAVKAQQERAAARGGKLLLRRGSYLTDGKRLVMVRAVLDDEVEVEWDDFGGEVDEPQVGRLTRSELAAAWRSVSRSAR